MDIGSNPRSGPGARTTVLILAEVRFYREGLTWFFSTHSRLEVVGSAEDPTAALRVARRTPFDVVLLDMAIVPACDAARAFGAVAPDAAIVALGVHEDEREVSALAEAGVSGFVARDASLDELALAVESAATGETRCSPRVAAILARRVSSLARRVQAEPATIPLTHRQLEIVHLLGEGLPNKVIAQRLFIEVPTVKNHVHNILERLGVQRREEAVRAVRALAART